MDAQSERTEANQMVTCIEAFNERHAEYKDCFDSKSQTGSPKQERAWAAWAFFKEGWEASQNNEED